MTNCDQVKRKICAEDNCRVVEGAEECHDKVVETTVEQPLETCSMSPEEECKNVTTSIPQVMSRLTTVLQSPSPHSWCQSKCAARFPRRFSC